nr:hypothetical protein [Pandoravirus massiliensis]
MVDEVAPFAVLSLVGLGAGRSGRRRSVWCVYVCARVASYSGRSRLSARGRMCARRRRPALLPWGHRRGEETDGPREDGASAHAADDDSEGALTRLFPRPAFVQEVEKRGERRDMRTPFGREKKTHTGENRARTHCKIPARTGSEKHTHTRHPGKSRADRQEKRMPKKDTRARIDIYAWPSFPRFSLVFVV